MGRVTLHFLCYILLYFFSLGAEGQDPETEEFVTPTPFISSVGMYGQDCETEKFITPSPLASCGLSLPSPGAYSSDNIELILAPFIKNFDSHDIVVFDVDEVLITTVDPFYLEHIEKETSLSQKFKAQNKSLLDKFFLYMRVASPYAIIEEVLPTLIKSLQLKGIKCIANTALVPDIDINLRLDLTMHRIQTLKKHGIDFSGAFPHHSLFTLKTHDDSREKPPLFREGIIFSSDTPKYFTLLDFFEKVEFTPKRVIFIDDYLGNIHLMQKELTCRNIQCYSFLYSKIHDLRSREGNQGIKNYFSREVFEDTLKILEDFLEKLVEGKNIEDFFHKLAVESC